LVRTLRLTLAGAAGALVALDLGLAWLFLDPLLRPDCPAPERIAAFSDPEVVILETADGLLLEGWYYPGANGRAVLALGGVGGSLGLNQPPITFLLEAGYGVLQIGSRACAGGLVTLGAREALDAEAGLRFLQTRPEAAPDGIALYGFSMGGAAAILAAARNPAVEALIAEGGYHNLGEDFVEPGSDRSLPEFVFLYTLSGVYWLRTGVDPWEISPIDAIGEIAPRPVLLIYGEAEAVSGRAAEQFAAAGEPKQLWLVPGGGHGTNHAAAGEGYEEKVLEFLAQTQEE
jgi:dipeptidyl aminopeptidase/acylaminoacyl peptidase